MRPRLDIHFERGQRIGLLGGSFNPAHEAHREISLMAMRMLGLQAVVWLVSPQNPLKSEVGMAPLDIRADYARKVARHPRVIVSTVEAQIGTRYTVDTISILRRRFVGVHFVLLLGADNLLQLPRWRRWTQIVEKIPIAVFGRPDSALKAPFGKAAQRFARARLPIRDARELAGAEPPAWIYVPHTALTQSSTHLREAGAWPG